MTRARVGDFVRTYDSRLSVVPRTVAESVGIEAAVGAVGVILVPFVKVRRRLKRASVVGWVALVPGVLLAMEPASPWRLPVIIFGVVMVGVSMLLVQVSLLGDYLSAYMMGFSDGRRVGDPEPGQRLRRVV